MKRAHSGIAVAAFALCIGLFVLLAEPATTNAQGRIAHFVSVGGPDVADPDLGVETGPGFDKDFALTAFLFADGTATGIFVDRFGGGGGLGLKAEIDCVYVEGNNAWVSGVIVQGLTLDENGNPVDLAGWYVRTRVQDNGPNNDPANPDRIGVSVFRPGVPWICSEKRGGAFDMPRGQAIVR